MIKTFADKNTEELFTLGECASFPSNIVRRALRKLDMIDNAYKIEDLLVPPGNRLHRLQGNRFGQYSISINNQWRICFRFNNSDAYEVEICDYH
jgi:proteic killer suppression protein